jgi:predicted secreted hydrolase
LIFLSFEFMSNSLAADQVGWDWMGLMLKDGRSLTVFQLRRGDGSSSFVSASLSTEGKVESVSGEDIKLTASNEWVSPLSKGRYPLSWRVQIPSRGIDLSLSARVQSCEIGEGASDVEPRYWEGPVASQDESVIGYLEMTGYAGKVTL